MSGNVWFIIMKSVWNFSFSFWASMLFFFTFMSATRVFLVSIFLRGYIQIDTEKDSNKVANLKSSSGDQKSRANVDRYKKQNKRKKLEHFEYLNRPTTSSSQEKSQNKWKITGGVGKKYDQFWSVLGCVFW